MAIEEDAREFGQHFEVGWHLGLLVARNVYKRAGAGRPPKSEPVRNKVSCAEFARLAGVSERTVQLVYDTWQLAAEEHHCTPAMKLRPGEGDPILSGVDVDDQEHREMWRKFYRQIRERRTGNSRGRSGSAHHREGRSHQADSSESQSGQPKTDPTAHPLYGLMLDINHLVDELKTGRPTSSLVEAARKVSDKKNRAALRRSIGVM